MLTDIHLPPLMPDKDNNFGGSLVLDFRKLRHYVQPENSIKRLNAKLSVNEQRNGRFIIVCEVHETKYTFLLY